MLPPDLAPTLATLHDRLQRTSATTIGFPVATDIDFSDLQALHNTFINNVGDPEKDGAYPRNTKVLEREVVAALIELFGGTRPSCWGYVTQGSTEGNQFGMWLARERYPGAVLYYSAAAHYSVAKAARFLRMDTAVVIKTHNNGELRYEDLIRAAIKHPDRPAIVVATAGTTMTEAVDDVASIHAALTEASIHARYLHVDGALSGVPLALDGGPISRLLSPRRNGTSTGADSVCVSGHKFFATPHVSGVVMVRREHAQRVARSVDYIDGLDTDGLDTTVSGSRSGHVALELWYVLNSLGMAAHRRRAEQARAVAVYTQRRLQEAGWETWRHPHSFTVVLKTPPEDIVRRWALATSDGWSHIVCMPGVTTSMIDMFLAELDVRMRAAVAAPVGEKATAVTSLVAQPAAAGPEDVSG